MANKPPDPETLRPDGIIRVERPFSTLFVDPPRNLVFRVIEDGEIHYWRASSMADAAKLAEDAHVKDQSDCIIGFNEAEVRKFYRSDLLDECSLVGKLENP